MSSATNVAPSGIVSLPNRSLIRISGRDAPKFLQGLTTNNVDPSRRDGWYTAFLNATGRIVTDAFLWPLATDAKGEWACLLDVDSSVSERLRIYLRKHKLRSKVEIRQLEGAQMWSAWDPKGSSTEPASYKAPELEGDNVRSWGHLSDPRLPGFSDRFITATDTSMDQTGIPEAFKSLPQTDLHHYNLYRYLNGVPEGPQEMFSEHYQAHPSNLDVLNAVDFRKGCYVGQELTIRTEHTGVVRKRILPVQIYETNTPVPTSLTYTPEGFDASAIPFETKITATGGKRETGKWLVGDGNVGLAMCRLENMTDVKVSAEGGTYADQSEFSLSSEGTESLRVKAFVPDWLRERLQRSRKPRT
jgi:folate-binding protein YgfZ